MDRSEQINELAAALAKAQATIEPAGKSHENPAFRSRYADLADVWAACRAALTGNGLAVVQLPEDTERGVCLVTTLVHSSGQWIAGRVPLLFDPTKMQSLGSALTYARRYGLAAMVGVVADDDDDGAAAGTAPAFPRTVAPPAPRPTPQRAPQRTPAPPPANGAPPPWDERYGPPNDARQLMAWAGKHGLTQVVAAIGKNLCGEGRIKEWDEDTVRQVVETIDADRDSVPVPDDGEIPF